MKYRIALAILINLLLINNLHSFKLDYFTGKIEKVIDGDTIIVNGKKIRFACVDTYESKKNKHLQKQVDTTGLNEQTILTRGLKQKKELEKYLLKPVKVYFNADSKVDLYGRILAVVLYQDIVLNTGMPYYDNNRLCKEFKINYNSKPKKSDECDNSKFTMNYRPKFNKDTCKSGL
jgi:endonuclease YncB( thermonuclease family)